MWIFTDFGFFSVVRHRTRHDHLVVRARSPQDLYNLVDKYGTVLSLDKSSVKLTPSADYGSRIEVSDDAWSTVVSSIAKSIDYDNFKDTVYTKMGPFRAHLCGKVWGTMLDLQRSYESEEDKTS
jgi:hypothetical protein